MENKRIILLKIEKLKNEIQYLMDKMNTYDPKEFEKELVEMYNEKLEKQNLLNEYNLKLKELIKEENKEKIINSNIGKLYKGKNLNETITKVNKAKELREKAKKEYIEFSKYELEYNKYDTRNIPGYIFLYQQILDTYGLCPYIKIKIPEFDLFSKDNKFYVVECDTEIFTVEIIEKMLNNISFNNIKDTIEEYNKNIESKNNIIIYEYTNKTLIEFASYIIDNGVKKKKLLEPDNIKNVIKSTNLLLYDIVENNRKEWLDKTDDKGLLYYQIRDKIVYNIDYNKSLSLRNNSEKELLNYVNGILTESQRKLLYDSVLFIENEYIKCSVKSKKIKERFKILLKVLALFLKETKLPIHEYLTIKYNIQFFIQSNEKESNFENKFNQLLETYKEYYYDTEQKRIYSHNMNRNLYDELCLFLTDKKEFISNNKNDVLQTGKYFRRWIALTKEERNERFESYADYYIEKYMIRENLITPIDKANLVEKLSKLLIYSYNKKHMIYRDFRWINKKGLIETVKVIRYNKEKNDFELTKILTNLDEDDNIKDKKCKKRSSFVSIFTSHEREVNEEILIFIVKYIQENEPKLIKKLENSTVEDCVNAVKNKMKLTKLQKDDKLLVTHKLREMYSIIRLSKLKELVNNKENTEEENVDESVEESVEESIDESIEESIEV